jgi:hypothetical protein
MNIYGEVEVQLQILNFGTKTELRSQLRGPATLLPGKQLPVHIVWKADWVPAPECTL